MDFKRTYEELNMLLSFSTDVKVQQIQREQMAVMSFLADLPSKFEASKSQILSSSEIPSLQDVFSRLLRTENTSHIQRNDVLVAKGRGNGYGMKVNNKGGGNEAINDRNNDSDNVVCYYCHESGHTKRFCRNLQIRNQKTQTANVVAAPSSSSEKTVMISADEFTKFSQYQESLKESNSVSALAESGKTCLISSSNNWVIDSSATDHMTGFYDEADYW